MHALNAADPDVRWHSDEVVAGNVRAETLGLLPSVKPPVRRPVLPKSDLTPSARAGVTTGGVAGNHKAALVCKHDGLYAVLEVQLGEDPVDVCLDGRQ